MPTEGLLINEIFEKKLGALKKLWGILTQKEFVIEGKVEKMDMMPFETIEAGLRKKDTEVSLVQRFGGTGLRASYDYREGIKIWFTNSFSESKIFKEAREEIELLWKDIGTA